MTDQLDEEAGTAVSVGDGSLGGAAIGGSLTGPDAGVIRDPVGPAVAVPLETEPDPPGRRADPTVDPTVKPVTSGDGA
jgi:hypothetical protein